MKRHVWIFPLSCALCAAMILSCADRTSYEGVRDEFDRIALETIALYRELHPLRWSAIGLAGADSLLFTFTEDDMERCGGRLDSLIEALSSLPAAGLDRDRIDDSFLMLDWMKGERFALGRGGACRSNPLLYCWMIEEALFGIPSRPVPPREGEAGEYARRLRSLPALAASAERLLERPGAPLLEEAAGRLDRIIETIPALDADVRRRYGRPVPECAAAAGPVARFREAVALMLEERPRGRVIMGLEDLSLVLGYAEHLDADPASLIAEAEAALRRLGKRPQPSRSHPVPSGGLPADPDSILSAIEEAIAARRIFGRAQQGLPVVLADPLYTPMDIPVDPYLTVPVEPRRRVRAELAAGSAHDCVAVTIVGPEPPGEPDRLFYDLLLSCSAVTAPAREACLADTPLRLVFSSETYRRGWESVVLQELSPLFPAHRAAVSRMEGEYRTLALARMVVVFRIHAGIYTTEAALAFLAETTGLPDDILAREVAAASASPAAAFDGIAAILLERIRKTAMAGQRGSAGDLRKILRENGMLPLALIEKKAPS